MVKNARVDENCDFQQVALPLDISIGEHVLQRIRFESNSEAGSWYELYLVVSPKGFLIEQHSGSLRVPGRLKETWLHRTLTDAKRNYSHIYSCKLSKKRRSTNKLKVVNDEKEGQQKLFG